MTTILNPPFFFESYVIFELSTLENIYNDYLHGLYLPKSFFWVLWLLYWIRDFVFFFKSDVIFETSTLKNIYRLLAWPNLWKSFFGHYGGNVGSTISTIFGKNILMRFFYYWGILFQIDHPPCPFHFCEKKYLPNGKIFVFISSFRCRLVFFQNRPTITSKSNFYPGVSQKKPFIFF